MNFFTQRDFSIPFFGRNFRKAARFYDTNSKNKYRPACTLFGVTLYTHPSMVNPAVTVGHNLGALDVPAPMELLRFCIHSITLLK
jgi:hypothetical protein